MSVVLVPRPLAWPVPMRLALLSCVVIGALVAAVRLGAVPLSTRVLLDALNGRGDPSTVTIIRELRLPRALQAALGGAALAVSGATFQALLRNPLADPYILGVSSGAAAGAVLTVVTGWSVRTVWALPLAAFAGAILSMLLVLRIAFTVGRALDTRVLLLAGVVVSAFLVALIWLVLTFADTESVRSAVFWMMGSHAGATWNSVIMLLLCIVPAFVVLLGLARPLNLLAIGEPTAAYLGTSVEKTKLTAFAMATLLAAVSVAASGTIGFVGLVVPHAIRLVWGSDNRRAPPLRRPRRCSVPRGCGHPVENARRCQRVADRDRDGADRRSVFCLATQTSGARMIASSPVAVDQKARAGALWSLREVRYRHPGADRCAVDGLSLNVAKGRLTAVVGPNGAGKSTLLDLMLGTRAPASGELVFAGRPLAEWARTTLAREIGVVPQGEAEPLFTVREMVAMGRYPHLGRWQHEREADVAAISSAMERCTVTAFADRWCGTLSGGERQRVRLARALAPATIGVFVLDEPTASLDVRHEMTTFELLRALRDDGVTVVLVTHHLNLAARYADELVLLHEGRLVSHGAPSEVLTATRISDVYQWPVAIGMHEEETPQVVPRALREIAREAAR